MSNTQTIPSTDIAPARAGFLGIGIPRSPSNLGAYETLAALTRRSGHEYELLSAAFGWFVWDATVGDAAGEGATREEALCSALENV